MYMFTDLLSVPPQQNINWMMAEILSLLFPAGLPCGEANKK